VKSFALPLLVVVALLQACSTPLPPRPSPPPVIEQGSSAPVQQPLPTAPSYPQSQTRTPSQTATSQPPAVVALLGQAETQANGGDLAAAAASLERALRIDPRNPVIWYHLATVRLEQGEPAQAEQLAVKSTSLAGGNPLQQARNWRLIAQARRAQGNPDGAVAAERRARELER
jgi:predicted Zn-dependent protease